MTCNLCGMPTTRGHHVTLSCIRALRRRVRYVEQQRDDEIRVARQLRLEGEAERNRHRATRAELERVQSDAARVVAIHETVSDLRDRVEGCEKAIAAQKTAPQA